MIQVRLTNHDDPNWSTIVDGYYSLLGAPQNESLLPPYFIKIVLAKLGGKLVLIERGSTPLAIGFLFPRKVVQSTANLPRNNHSGPRLYTMRFHPLIVLGNEEQGEMRDQVNRILKDGRVVFYDPMGYHSYCPTSEKIGDISVGSPSQEEAGLVRTIHQKIWQSDPGSLYPVDIHSREFGLATDLVARANDSIAGFLFGFYKEGTSTLPSGWRHFFGGDWRIESQVMGVVPQFRGRRIGYILKRAQGELALRDGIGIVNWTADPLQFPNAALNFGLLRAVAFDYYPDLYPFRNELNRVATSRLGLTWLPGTQRVRNQPLTGHQTTIVDVSRIPVQVINERWQKIDTEISGERIAIEIPADWTDIQKNDVEAAGRWRMATDELFSRYIGLRDGQFTVTGVGQKEQRRYLIAERSSESLWSRLEVI